MYIRNAGTLLYTEAHCWLSSLVLEEPQLSVVSAEISDAVSIPCKEEKQNYEFKAIIQTCLIYSITFLIYSVTYSIRVVSRNALGLYYMYFLLW